MRLLLSVLAAFVAMPALALPWAEAGDKQMRQDVELLKAARLIKGPVSTWPLPWAQIVAGVEAAEANRVPPHVAAAARRLGALADIADAKTSYEARVGGTNRPALVRDFGFSARERADAAVRVHNRLGQLYVSYGAGYRHRQRGSDFHFEPGSAVFVAGNWGIYGGYVEKWWGPGNDGALFISNNARPFPKIGVTRMVPYAPEPKLLRWVGPWRLDFYGGVLNEKRADSENPIQFGMQFNFEPAAGLEINLNRTLLVCGGGRADSAQDSFDPTEGGLCNASAITRSLFPFFPGAKPGDSLAGFAVSYTRMLGPVAAKIYFDVAGEDKDGRLQFEQVGQIGGGSLSGPIGAKGATWSAFAEYTDTLANFVLSSRNVPGSFYNNTYYFSGKTYRGQAIGHSIDGDSRLFTLAGAVTDTNNRRWYGSYRVMDLNFTEALNAGGAIANRVSATREDIDIATAGVEWPTRFGDIRVEGRYMTDRPGTPGERRESGELEVSWRTRF